MEDWSECLDSFLVGVVIGLAMSIVVAICTTQIDLYYFEKEKVAYQQALDEEFERQRLEAEGWITE